MSYPEREKGEDDKAYLKRVAHRLPVPEQLSGPHGDYFVMDGAVVMPIEVLRSSKAVSENRRAAGNAAKFMAAAQAGVVSRRAPLRVRAIGDGTFMIVDGNATLSAATQYGWPSVPVRIDAA